MLGIFRTTKFKKDFKVITRRNYNIDLLKNVILLLVKEEELPMEYKDHPLKGKYTGYRDCHIENDWVLIYKVKEGVLHLARTGTHSDLGL